MDRAKIQLLYCEWCPQDCQGLTREEEGGCVASGGFVDALQEEYRKNPPEVLSEEEIKRVWDEDGDGWISWVQFGQAVAQTSVDDVVNKFLV